MLVPTLTDNENDLISLGRFLKDLTCLEKIEVLPYHTMGIPKYEALGIDYPLKGVDNATKGQADKALEIILNSIKGDL